MNPAVLIGGISLCLLAALAVVFLVIAPPPPRVAADRRRAPGVEHVSALSKITQRATAVVEGATSNRRARLFGEEELDLAGIKSEPSSFLIVVASAASVAALVGALVGLSSGRSIILALLFALLTPVVAKVVVVLRTARRRARFADQIDDTVQLIAGGLRAGHGLSRTVGSVAQDAAAPMSEELARVVNETRLGRNLADALAVAAQRMKSQDFEWVAQAIAINIETGGNLAQILDQVGRTIRERNEIRRQVSALSAEGRLSGIILVALPIGVFLFLVLVQPLYASVFFTTVIGWIALAVGVVLLIVGSLWTAAVVKVKF